MKAEKVQTRVYRNWKTSNRYNWQRQGIASTREEMKKKLLKVFECDPLVVAAWCILFFFEALVSSLFSTLKWTRKRIGFFYFWRGNGCLDRLFIKGQYILVASRRFFHRFRSSNLKVLRSLCASARVCVCGMRQAIMAAAQTFLRVHARHHPACPSFSANSTAEI